MNKPFPQALTIAGSDSGGGAGIQADLKTMQMQHVFGTSVLTAVTAQNTQGVTAIHPIPLDIIRAQYQAVTNDFDIVACKLGMLSNAAIIHCVAKLLQQSPIPFCVIDPVMIAKGGTPLLETQAIEALKTELLPLADVLTPNIPEAEALTGLTLNSKSAIERAAEQLQNRGAKMVVIKGGHAEGEQSIDYVFTPQQQFTLSAPRINTPHTHGTGCTFSACITAELAKGASPEQAVRSAKAFITAAISHSLEIGHGHGPTNHWAYSEEKS